MTGAVSIIALPWGHEFAFSGRITVDPGVKRIGRGSARENAAMKFLQEKPRSYEFNFPHMGTRLQVEELGGDVTIRATRDTFSLQRKISFIRELAAEGFIPDDFMWLSIADADAPGRGVVWIVDSSWLTLDENDIARARRILNKALAAAFLLFAFEMALVLVGFVGNGGSGASRDQAGQISGPHWRR
jgi:hypothetical protein